MGPNGSGKSNISDAILWVMGEQSSKTLRGGKMQDVIFGGTAKRGAMGFAQVSLIIDNSAGILGIDSEEVTITRRYYRSGESEYYINREQVRLRDVNELLMDTGLGRDGYPSSVRAGIAEIVNGKSAERREVLEEAAGISRFRYRKEEAERRLAKTDENLLRINDKIDELELQVRYPARAGGNGAIPRPAGRAQGRGSQRVDGCAGQAARADRRRLLATMETAKSGLDAAQRELEALYSRSEALAERMRRRTSRLSSRGRDCLEAEAKVSRQRPKPPCSATASKTVNRPWSGCAAKLSSRPGRAASIGTQIDEHRARMSEIDERAKSLEADAASARNVMDGRRMRIENREREAAEANDALTKQIVELRSAVRASPCSPRWREEYEGFAGAVKTVMRAGKAQDAPGHTRHSGGAGPRRRALHARH